ncbi:MAG: HAD hydrolase-like protein, partial [Prevotella sp.]|nr:HAD hydrolase-like protein [Prevotella sp.]
MNTYKTYIFDLDGTLLDTLNDLHASCNYALRTHGMPERSLEEVRQFVGNGVKK